ncbi:hypothetical protein AC1031_005920 [Aphanomyces cochlioides]|nr:hypothetical protein AC1031_005920 [Aphanomyces cochlioides]
MNFPLAKNSPNNKNRSSGQNDQGAHSHTLYSSFNKHFGNDGRDGKGCGLWVVVLRMTCVVMAVTSYLHLGDGREFRQDRQEVYNVHSDYLNEPLPMGPMVGL